MKRKIDDTDLGYYEMPSKIPTSVPLGYYGFQNQPTASPIHIGHPMSASTPHSQTTNVGGKIHRQQFAPTRVNASMCQQQLSQSAETELRHVIDNFVTIYEQLDKNDDVDVKPNYSYTELAYLAMLRSPNFSLPIAQIYSYIQSRFKFFRNSTRKHWKNAVRHSLAKTMCFTKIAVGRGTSNNENLARSTYLWCILPNSIATFARGDYRATVDKETGTNTLRSAYFSMNAGHFWDRIGDYIANKMAVFRNSVETTTNPGAIFESQICSVPIKQEPVKIQAIQPRQAFKSVKNEIMSQSVALSQRQTNCSPQMHQPFQQERYARLAPTPNQHSTHIGYNAHPQMRSRISYNGNIEDRSLEFDLQQLNGNNSSDFVTDPWLPKISLQSPNTSCGGIESGRSTPVLNQTNLKPTCSTPYSSYNHIDSGFETAESISIDNSCQFYSACKMQDNRREIASPIPGDGQFNGEDLLDSMGDFEQFELPPLCINDLSDFGDNFEANLSQGCLTPQKQISDTATFPVPQYIGAPQLVSTPISAPTNAPMYGYQQAIDFVPKFEYGAGTIPVSSVVGYTTDGRAVFAAPSFPYQKWEMNC